ncbi:hypothetical protein B9T29_10745 [Acinetobacter sp. ANC 3903]|uniref:hypothetical protein n=1 Tax=Acinetobacter sp. ANC 3903 TaxID=1977883 RepID=UPI000A33DE0E|nr:hypothetical protein [Acinetobacter sp. ANC 3903]OTG61631.1 hypothetical protein B9T29_10745 [Acinetobacter sp. ANC 3903]
MNKKSLYWGIGITVVWLAVIISFWIFGGLKSPQSLNEFGDFLAGIFAPVAFFWLILGYVQQGKQLDQNTKALEQQERALQLQIDEMKESVKQQKEIAIINEKSLHASFEKERPEISYWFPSGYKHGESYTLLLKIHNIGKGDCYNIKAFVKNKKSTRDLKNFLKVQDSISISLNLFDESAIEVFDEKLLNLNEYPFMTENAYIGKGLDVEIIFEFENIYGHRFEEVFEINFPLMENFDTTLRQYNFDSN